MLARLGRVPLALRVISRPTITLTGGNTLESSEFYETKNLHEKLNDPVDLQNRVSHIVWLCMSADASIGGTCV